MLKSSFIPKKKAERETIVERTGTSVCSGSKGMNDLLACMKLYRRENSPSIYHSMLSIEPRMTLDSRLDRQSILQLFKEIVRLT